MTVENSNFEHECHLLNKDELSRSQKYELQRFIEQNSYLLRSASSQGDSLTGWKDKESNQFNSYQRNGGTSSISPNRSRKEVKWSDDIDQSSRTIRQASSLSPNWSVPGNRLKNSNSFDNLNNIYNSGSGTNSSKSRSRNTMSQYGNIGYASRGRDNQFYGHSPTNIYQSYGKHPDDYNRYETARSRSHRQREEDERSRFSGYGDRPGSGVEFMPTKWHGGEIITDPEQLPRSLKPRRLYYSPIGDGVVAADGVELKRAPKDLSPRITVTHKRTVDRGEPGQPGYNLYARTGSHELGNDYGSDMGGSGRDSRLTGGISPGSDSYGQSGGMGSGPGMSYGGGGLPGSGSGYGTGSGGGNTPCGPGKDYLSDTGSGDTGYPSNRSGYTESIHESVKSERYHKFDVTKDYLITNPRELIHQYATQTPISVLEIPETSRTVKKMYSSTTEEKYVPYPPYKASDSVVHPNNFTRQLRDEGLTASQREANRHQNPLTNDSPEIMHKITKIRKETSRIAPTNTEIDSLTEKMMHNL